MAKSPEFRAHQEWLGYLQPVGLVVSPPALLAAQAHINRNIVPAHQRFLKHVADVESDGSADVTPVVTDLPGLFHDAFDWATEDLVGGPGADPLPSDLEVNLPEYNETLGPTYAVPEPEPEADDASRWQLLIQTLENGTCFDEAHQKDERRWQASSQSRFERLLRETGVPAGLLANGTGIRLVYAPRGETSGYVTFPVKAMTEVAGRPIFAALHMLLSSERLFTLPRDQRLPALLCESRKYQNDVSTKLADQVLGSQWELLRGFQAADEATNGRLLSTLPREDPDHIYGGLLTVLLRLVFLLYAEDRGLMPGDSVYAGHYAVAKLYERLREDAGRYTDTMDQRYGAWAWLLSLFRLVFDGGGHGLLHLPARHGQLFNPDEYPFLEGRPLGVARVMGERIDAPRISDGCVHRVLQALLVLDGERLSYRSLDVEQIGSVYEAMMGFEVEQALGRSIGVRRRKKGMDLDVVLNVEELLELEGGKRKKWLKDTAECDLTGSAATDLKNANTPEDVVAALGRKVSPRTPTLLPPGALYLQPGEERRRSGSHYTPRELTEPIVRTTLRPVLEALGERPTPDQILDLKVCDPAMGSGAFLVEACRQLADKLVEAWELHDCLPEVPPDEDPLLYARRLIAQRCLYGVDKNPFAVNLAKLSLWLVTLARDHPFTFIDHALRSGDSLVGLTRDQIGVFDWKPQKADHGPLFHGVEAKVTEAVRLRTALVTLGDHEELEKRALLQEVDHALLDARFTGDLVITAFFGAATAREREALRLTYRRDFELARVGDGDLSEVETIPEALRTGDRPVPPFHWELEFPEVFARSNPGFDVVVGNPPFAGKNTTISAHREGYPDWLKANHPASHGNADLVAHFYRRAFDLMREGGCFGLIATNTIAQGDTRHTGLRWICTHDGVIYSARKRVRWPGRSAAVVVSVVHVAKGFEPTMRVIDGREVDRITAFLFHRGAHEKPAELMENSGKAFIGSVVLGKGFIFDDNVEECNPLVEMNRLIDRDSRNAERIQPYLGGSELLKHPEHKHHRYVINFGDMSEEEARRWPDLFNIVETKVKPMRLAQNRAIRARYWWRFGETAPALNAALETVDRVLMHAFTSTHLAFAFVPSTTLVAGPHHVIALSSHSAFCVLQSRVHEIWARFFSSSMEDRLRYSTTDAFRTFPFPRDWRSDPDIEVAGKEYYEFRAHLMIRTDQGLTATLNRFHDPGEREPMILKLRQLHANMDRAVLAAYSWTEISTDCEFLLDYEIDEQSWSPRRRRPWRYRWPEEIHEEVLARVLELNQKRAKEERRVGVT